MALPRKGASLYEEKTRRESVEIASISSDEDKPDCVITKVLPSPARSKKITPAKGFHAVAVTKRGPTARFVQTPAGDMDAGLRDRLKGGSGEASPVSLTINATGRAPKCGSKLSRNISRDIYQSVEGNSLFIDLTEPRASPFQISTAFPSAQGRLAHLEGNAHEGPQGGDNEACSMEMRTRSMSTATLVGDSSRASVDTPNGGRHAPLNCVPVSIKEASCQAQTSDEPAFSRSALRETATDLRRMPRCARPLSGSGVLSSSISTGRPAEPSFFLLPEAVFDGESLHLQPQPQPQGPPVRSSLDVPRSKIGHGGATPAPFETNVSAIDGCGADLRIHGSNEQRRVRQQRGLKPPLYKRPSRVRDEAPPGWDATRERRLWQRGIDRRRGWSSVIDLTSSDAMPEPIFRQPKEANL